ncbi:MAG: T9SS type A sorting domain-containing protein [Taibaiella sp.]|jgi:photosystem II stability/assembly factor-like uncharacterized protein
MKQVIIIILLFAGLQGFGQQQPYWHNVLSGTTKKLLSISFGDAATGYIGGEDSLLLKTTDGGETWHPISLTGVLLPLGADDIEDVEFLSASVGYITATNHTFPYLRGDVYKTSNGGTSWTFVDAGNTAAYRTHFLAEGEGYVIGSAFFAGNVVSKISAGAPADYHTFSFNPSAFNLSIDFLNTQTGIVGGEMGQVYRTFNEGSTWDTIQASPFDTAIYAIKFLNDSTILAATVGVLLISHDTGSTWDTDFGSLTFDYPVMKAITFSLKDSFIAVGNGETVPEEGLIYWHDHTANKFQHVDHPLYSVAMSNDTIAYAVGDSGLIVTNKPAPVNGIDAPASIVEKLKLYPNPTTGMCTTVLPIPHTIKVYDISGKLILNNDKPALKQSLNLSAYASGTYYLDIETELGKISRKLVLLQ